MRASLCILIFAALLPAMEPQAIIIDSGSTNRPGMQVTVNEAGHANIESRTGEARTVQLEPELAKRFLEEVKAAAPLDTLPTRHCVKSVSFGSSLFVEFNGVRSHDLSCQFQPDDRAAALQKDAQAILQAAKQR